MNKCTCGYHGCPIDCGFNKRAISIIEPIIDGWEKGLMESILKNLEKENEKLRNKLDIALEALEFYACTDNWITGRDSDFICDRITDDDENMYPHGYSVGGSRARKALAKIKETKK